MLSLLRVLLVHPELHCAGLVRLTQLTFQGLKRSKRWDALLTVSTQLLDAHSAAPYERNVPKLDKLAELFSGTSSSYTRCWWC
ncbi:putative ubiquitin-specific protease [Phytophthora cinnamomi]|uniref:putative ubiquitin-specific protease n=1 Tax=Phytophthora cinnamomi TaxID=4785 RepID=UPI00355A05D8|nr:putative ubiquitin-specific protease [Phytophthora cinnamomi]